MKLLPEVVHTAAKFSSCGTYRYTLMRAFARPRLDHLMSSVTWVMLNPSTATQDEDDPTVRRCQTFSRSWGFELVWIVNIFALRSTDPRALYSHPDPTGPDNDMHIQLCASISDLVIAAWGVHGAYRNRGEQVRKSIEQAAPDRLHVLKLTKDGHPGHPLYVKGTTLPTRWGY